MWHRLFPRFCGRFYFSAITRRGGDGIPDTGPVLWLGLHRNGAVDGFVYAAALCRSLVFMISTQLRKNFLARIFFNGIAVARNAAEGDRSANRAALAACVALLREGGELFVFPEGTSALGPRHLPFKAGAVQLILDWLESDGGALNVVPLGVHYDCAPAFRSRVEVVIGAPVTITLAAELPALGRLRELRQRTTLALESVGVNFPDAATQRDAEALATIAASETGQWRFAVLKRCEDGPPAGVAAAWRTFDAAAVACGALRWHGVPMVSRGAGLRTALELIVVGPLVMAGIALNAPPWLAAATAAKKLPDDTNVISLWKILVGLPAFVLWLVVVVGTLSLLSAWGALGGYLLLTFIAWAGYDHCAKRLAVGVYNGTRHGALRPLFAAVVDALSRLPPK